MSDTIDIELWVEDKAHTAIKRFYPTKVSKDLALPLNLVFEKLVLMAQENKLNLYWEIRCPECYRTCEIITDIESKRNKDIICPIGDEFIVTLDIIFPIFEITDYYKGKVRDYKKKK